MKQRHVFFIPFQFRPTCPDPDLSPNVWNKWGRCESTLFTWGLNLSSIITEGQFWNCSNVVFWTFPHLSRLDWLNEIKNVKSKWSWHLEVSTKFRKVVLFYSAVPSESGNTLYISKVSSSAEGCQQGKHLFSSARLGEQQPKICPPPPPVCCLLSGTTFLTNDWNPGHSTACLNP